MYKLSEQPDVEAKIQAQLDVLLSQLDLLQSKKKKKESWIDVLFNKLISDPQFRIQALRFIDVLPTLQKDADLIHHLQDYFQEDEFPLPSLLKWGLNRTHRAVSSHLVAPTVRRVIQVLAKRFLASDDLKSLLSVKEALAKQGAKVSMDLLGEISVSHAESDRYLATYLNLIEQLSSQLKPGDEPVNLSIKPSSLYSQLSPVAHDASVKALTDRLRALLRAASSQNVTIIFDMEQYALKNIIIDAFKSVLMEREFLHVENVGIAIQAYLKDSVSDVEQLLKWCKQRHHKIIVRLVRGAYWDHETILAKQQGWPCPVWSSKSETDIAYEHCLRQLLSEPSLVYTAVATHNVRSVVVAQVMAEEFALEPHQFEFQMLYGMGENLCTQVIEGGYQVRVYLPFGQLLPGMSYLVRRLLENSSSQSMLVMMGLPDHHADYSAPLVVASEEKEHESQQSFQNFPHTQFIEPSERDEFERALAVVKQKIGQDYPLMIAGEVIPAEHHFCSYNPSVPDQVIGRFAAATESDVKQAVLIARENLAAWRAWGMEKRIQLLKEVAALLEEQLYEFAALQVLEVGKSWVEAVADVTEAIDFLHYYSDHAKAYIEPHNHHLAGELNTSRYESLGVGAVISPWNFPLALMVGMVTGSLVTGNTLVLKPSSDGATVAAWFVKLLEQAGLPKGVLSFLPGPGQVIGRELVSHPNIKFIVFTGSLEVGREIIKTSAEPEIYQHHFKRVIAEMGGKNAIIVDSDADIDEAVLAIVHSAFGFQGQKCSACSRVIVLDSIKDILCERLIEATKSLITGSPESPENQFGPVINAQVKQQLESIIETGKDVATLALAIDLSQRKGHFVGP
ncbi:MAG: bifunctional proline dehydrogenase/L-glutamate gamma-semialdehyde dehydrogenase, partial [Methylococcales bacterium]|nr:bifunctional proline dehydrogenase/L-glutamate gamma-semialdehyde dehydrogenase [Methylococcales bacterium]